MILLRIAWRFVLFFWCCEGLLAVRWNFGLRFCLLMLAFLSVKHFLLQFLPVTEAHTLMLHAAYVNVVLTILWRFGGTVGDFRLCFPGVVYVPPYHSGHKILRLIGISQKMTLLVVEPLVAAVSALLAARTPVYVQMRPFWHYIGNGQEPLPPLPVLSFPVWYPQVAPLLAWLWLALMVGAFFLNNRAEYALLPEAAQEGMTKAEKAIGGPTAPPEPTLEFPRVRTKRSGKTAVRTPSVQDLTREAQQGGT